MKKEARVHRLATEESYIHLSGSELHWEPELVKKHKMLDEPECVPQHLYITTDEEIKEGDWYLNLEWNTIKQYQGEKISKDWNKKIIATTDPKIILKRCSGCEENIPLRKNGTHSILNEGVGLTCTKKTIPQIPQSFIKEYCKAGGIDKVLVEYEKKIALDGHTYIGFELKLDNNCIIIHPVEEDKVLTALQKFWNSAVIECSVEFDELPKWIEENL